MKYFLSCICFLGCGAIAFAQSVVSSSNCDTVLTVDDSIRLDELQNQPDNKKWCLGVKNGYNVMLAPEDTETPKELAAYKNSLRTGFHVGADATFFLSPNIGLGAKYLFSNANNDQRYLAYTSETGAELVGLRHDNINVQFFGPSLSIRSIPKNNKLYVSYDFTLGYSLYNNSIMFNDENYNIQGQNIGFASSVGADFMLNKKLSLGISLDIVATTIKKNDSQTLLTLGEKDSENFSRLSLGLTLKTYR
jgi:opacity protein-like surface antigen